MSDDSTEEQTPDLTAKERELGMDADITRRDFLNAVALGTGAALLGSPAPAFHARPGGPLIRPPATPGDPWDPWTGNPGVGDYARSNGNTWDVVTAAHGLRDGTYDKLLATAADTGEIYDCVIVGGGFSGTVAAYTFLKETRRQRSCLLLDNHPIIGGEAKRNEFVVRGHRLIGPQGSNEGDPPEAGTPGWMASMWHEIGLPVEFEFGQLAPGRRPMIFPKSNYVYQLWFDNFENHGFYYDSPRPHWVRNPWGHRLEGTPYPPEVRRDLLRWREELVEPWKGDADSLMHYLDTMTYEQWLTGVRKLHPEVARYVDPIYASGIGLGSDVLSAYSAYTLALPGFRGLGVDKGLDAFIGDHTLREPQKVISFPGGNDAIQRCIVKSLNPEVIEGSTAFAEVHNGRIRFEMMDRPHTPCRLRAGALVVHLDHDPDGAGVRKPATVTYVKDGKLYTVRARTVIWAGASFTAKHAVKNLPEDYRAAVEQFPRSPMMSVNVALDNWRFLDKLGYTACSWRGGFGFTANMRPNMYVGDYRPLLDPDQPNLFTFYVPFNQHGLSLVDQGHVGRARLFSTSYREYETQVRQQMVTLFADAGFDPKRDVAGIVLNRWGHAYCNAGPGFHTSKNGKPTPSDLLRQPIGQLTFGHSELNGNQHWDVAAKEGHRAAQQVVEMLTKVPVG
jgi:spermidine dehydrogenase